MPKKDKKRSKKDKAAAGAAEAVDAVRHAVERTFSASAEGAKSTRGRAKDVTNAANRIREVLEERVLGEIKGLRSDIEGLSKRVTALEVNPRGTAGATRRPAAKPFARRGAVAGGDRHRRHVDNVAPVRGARVEVLVEGDHTGGGCAAVAVGREAGGAQARFGHALDREAGGAQARFGHALDREAGGAQARFGHALDREAGGAQAREAGGDWAHRGVREARCGAPDRRVREAGHGAQAHVRRQAAQAGRRLGGTTSAGGTPSSGAGGTTSGA